MHVIALIASIHCMVSYGIPYTTVFDKRNATRLFIRGVCVSLNWAEKLNVVIMCMTQKPISLVIASSVE